jgi:hypothetical protein
VNVIKEIYNVIRYKFKLPIIRFVLILILFCVLIVPTVLLENQEMPAGNENLFYLGSMKGSVLGTGNSNQFAWTYMLLNHDLKQVKNASIKGCAYVCVHDISSPRIVCHHTYMVTSKTNETGIAKFSLSYIEKLVGSGTGNYNLRVTDFYIENFSLPEKAMQGKSIPKYKIFSFSSKEINQDSEHDSIIYYASLPTRMLGYNGLTPVFYSYATHNSTTITISYKLYNPQKNIPMYKQVNLTILNSGQVYTDTNYVILKEFNEAYNVSFYANGVHKVGSLFNKGDFIPKLGGSVYNDFGSIQTEIALLVSLFMTLIIFTPMYNSNVYQRYYSLPETRRRMVLVQLSSSMIVSSIYTGIGIGATFCFFLSVCTSVSFSLFLIIHFYYNRKCLFRFYLYLYAVELALPWKRQSKNISDNIHHHRIPNNFWRYFNTPITFVIIPTTNLKLYLHL